MKRKSHHAQRAGHHSGATDRGVTRHSMEHKPEHETDLDARMKMLEKHHHATLWIYWNVLERGHDRRRSRRAYSPDGGFSR